MGLKMPNFSNGRRITDAGCKMWVSGAAEEPDKRGPPKRHIRYSRILLTYERPRPQTCSTTVPRDEMKLFISM